MDINYEQITACEHEQAGKPELYQGGRCFLGMYTTKKCSAIFVYEDIGGVLWLREMIELNHSLSHEHWVSLIRCFETYNIEKAVIDETGMARLMLDKAQDVFGFKVHGVFFTRQTETTVASLINKRLENGDIKNPPLPHLRESILSGLSNSQRHCLDHFWGVGLACFAAAI